MPPKPPTTVTGYIPVRQSPTVDSCIPGPRGAKLLQPPLRTWQYSLKLSRSTSTSSSEAPLVTSHCWRSPISWPDRPPSPKSMPAGMKATCSLILSPYPDIGGLEDGLGSIRQAGILLSESNPRRLRVGSILTGQASPRPRTSTQRGNRWDRQLPTGVSLEQPPNPSHQPSRKSPPRETWIPCIRGRAPGRLSCVPSGVPAFRQSRPSLCRVSRHSGPCWDTLGVRTTRPGTS